MIAERACGLILNSSSPRSSTPVRWQPIRPPSLPPVPPFPVAPVSLPIDAALPELLARLSACGSAVLHAPPGAGKTTRVPPALLDSGRLGDRRVVVLEPRRVAARAAAQRIAWERGEEVGETVGYQVRFERRVGPRTRIELVTEGIFLRMLQTDPFLERVGAVVFDEFHERSLAADLALAMTRRVQETVRPDLRIVVMSATLDATRLVEFLGQPGRPCPLVSSLGRSFPVEIRYLPAVDRAGLEERTAAAVAQVLDGAGDVLAFLPGVGEIRKTRRLLERTPGVEAFRIHELYGDLPPAEQDAVLAPAAVRKIVLATNVAETSLTIPGVTTVVDSGYARVLRHDPAIGLDRLELGRISRASAAQRAGRAGRTAPGRCVRLWSEREQQALLEHDEPEIRRVDLAGALLQLSAWGEADLAQFPWFEAPSAVALERGQALLNRLGACRDGRVTDVGRQLARLPVQPRLGRLLLEGAKLGAAEDAALAAALLSERDPFVRGSQGRKAVHRSESDVADRIGVLRDFERTGETRSELGELHEPSARFLLRARDQLLREVRELDVASRPSVPAYERLGRALLAAFPDRLARRREPGSRRAVMLGGRGVRLDERSAVSDAELFLCLEVEDAGAEGLVRQAAAVRREWLDPQALRTETALQFDPQVEKVVGRKRTLCEDLVLDEADSLPDDRERTAEFLYDHALPAAERVEPDDAAWRAFQARVACLRGWRPNWELPAWEEVRPDVLRELCAGRRSFAELRSAPWLATTRARLTGPQQAALDREAPERIAVPSGNRLTLTYEPGRPPVLAVKIQEMFGLAETPRIAGGTVPVLLHLLGPNGRPQQITDDLRSFWNNTYQQVKKDLKRRYPKHAWPDDPWNAPPQQRPGRPARGA